MFTKAKITEGYKLTATEKKYAMLLINENKPEFIGVWVKYKNTHLMAEKISYDTYVIKTRISQNLGAMGSHFTTFESTIKFS